MEKLEKKSESLKHFCDFLDSSLIYTKDEEIPKHAKKTRMGSLDHNAGVDPWNCFWEEDWILSWVLGAKVDHTDAPSDISYV